MRHITHILRSTLPLVLLLMLAACGSGPEAAQTAPPETAAPETAVPETAVPETAAPAAEAELVPTHIAAITIKDYGTITLELYGEIAPITVDNFVSLAESGFYDGLTFHRIIDGFMIQGGSPDGTGSGGSETRIRGEFASNGTENPISHIKGTISMARSQDPDSARSQFFITVGDALHLDGGYAAFGRVIDGMEVAERIAADARPTDSNGSIPAEERPVIESITISPAS